MMQQLELFSDILDFRLHVKYRKGVFKTKEEITQELIESGRSQIYRVLSFGGGTQSAHLLEQHLRGCIHYDLIVFSDTGAEPDFILKQIDWWQKRQKECGNKTPFLITHHGSMKGGLEEMLMRYIYTDYQRFQMPVYCVTKDEQTGELTDAGMMPRQCTVDFKIIPVKQMVRRFIMKQHGLTPKRRFPENVGIIIDIGFSYDEIRRINTYRSPQYKYIYLAYPLVEENFTTKDSIAFLESNDFPTRRSRCYLCPFNCEKEDTGMDWHEIIEEEPLSFLKACWFDEMLRIVQRTGNKVMKSIPYLHHSRRPLKEVFRNDYVQLYSQLEQELHAWIANWKSRILRDYLSGSDAS